MKKRVGLTAPDWNAAGYPKGLHSSGMDIMGGCTNLFYIIEKHMMKENRTPTEKRALRQAHERTQEIFRIGQLLSGYKKNAL